MAISAHLVALSIAFVYLSIISTSVLTSSTIPFPQNTQATTFTLSQTNLTNFTCQVRYPDGTMEWQTCYRVTGIYSSSYLITTLDLGVATDLETAEQLQAHYTIGEQVAGAVRNSQALFERDYDYQIMSRAWRTYNLFIVIGLVLGTLSVYVVTLMIAQRSSSTPSAERYSAMELGRNA